MAGWPAGHRSNEPSATPGRTCITLTQFDLSPTLHQISKSVWTGRNYSQCLLVFQCTWTMRKRPDQQRTSFLQCVEFTGSRIIHFNIIKRLPAAQGHCRIIYGFSKLEVPRSGTQTQTPIPGIPENYTADPCVHRRPHVSGNPRIKQLFAVDKPLLPHPVPHKNTIFLMTNHFDLNDRILKMANLVQLAPPGPQEERGNLLNSWKSSLGPLGLRRVGHRLRVVLRADPLFNHRLLDVGLRRGASNRA